MNVRQTILIPVLGLVFLINSATAGVLDDNLAEKVKSLRSDEMVKVWIKLPRLEEPSKVRSSANAVAATRAGRYQYAAERFRQGHRIAQAELLSVLGGLERQNVASHVKGHWVANIVEAEVAGRGSYLAAGTTGGALRCREDLRRTPDNDHTGGVGPGGRADG